MEKTRTIVDRERLSSDYIEARQDFKSVLNQAQPITTTSWSSPWFYGPIGLAVTAVTISIVSLNPTNVLSSTNELNESVKPIQEKVSMVNENDRVEELLKEKVITTTDDVVIETEKVSVKQRQHIPVEQPVIDMVEVDPMVEESAQFTVVEEKSIPSTKNYKMPNIEGVFTGDIALEKLFSPSGIRLNESVEIVSFELNYNTGSSNVVRKVEGNQLPEQLKEVFEFYNKGQMIFITNIRAIDEKGNLFVLPSLNYIPN